MTWLNESNVHVYLFDVGLALLNLLERALRELNHVRDEGARDRLLDHVLALDSLADEVHCGAGLFKHLLVQFEALLVELLTV